MDRELHHYDTDVFELQGVIENVDNQSRKNNGRLKVLKEGAGGQDLNGYLEKPLGVVQALTVLQKLRLLMLSELTT